MISFFSPTHVNIKAHSRITLSEKKMFTTHSKHTYFNYESCLWIICHGHIMADDSIFAEMTVVSLQNCRGIETSGFLKHCVIQFQLQVDNQRTNHGLSDVYYTQKCKTDLCGLIGGWVCNTICVIDTFVAFKLLKAGFTQHKFKFFLCFMSYNSNNNTTYDF